MKEKKKKRWLNLTGPIDLKKPVMTFPKDTHKNSEIWAQ